MVVHNNNDFDPLGELWNDKIVPQLERLIARYPEYMPWGIEGIKNAIMADHYALIEFDDAFLIVEEDREYLHGIVAAGFDGSCGMLPEYARQVAELAAKVGMAGFKFTTPREGWAKAAPKAGFKVLSSEVTYIYEV